MDMFFKLDKPLSLGLSNDWYWLDLSDPDDNSKYYVSRLEDNKTKLEIPIPGVQQSEIKISTKDNILSVELDPKNTLITKKAKYEWSLSGFSGVESAILKDGILTILLIKKPPNVQTIEVKVE